MKCTSWNINGIRSAIRTGFLDTLAAESPDIFAFQEVK